MEITTQAESFGLPERNARQAPDPKEVEAQLKPPTPWAGPEKLDIE